ncbi:MAG: TonB-dependent receptor, partial [Pseudomonadota bacterium]
GAEIDAKWSPDDNLDLFASAAYVETEFLEFLDGGNDFSGNEFRDAPNFTASAGATYNFDNGTYVSGDVSYTGTSYSDAANTIRNDSRFLVNLRIGHREENWEIFAYARNLFDEEYLSGGATIGANTFAFSGEPRTVGVVFQGKL